MKSAVKTFLIIALISLITKFDFFVMMAGIEMVKSIYSILSMVYIGVGMLILIIAYLKDKEMQKMGENLDKEEGELEQKGLSRICTYAIAIILAGFIFLA